jgi:CRISPR-associated protein Cas1
LLKVERLVAEHGLSLNAVDRIEIGPEACATMTALRHALATDTALAFVDGHGESLGWLAPRFGPRAARHLAQARHVLDDGLRLALARKFVEGRLRNHRALLRRLNRERLDPAVTKTLVDINMMIRGIGEPKSLSELLGHEGRGAALFWPAFARTLNHGFTFSTRVHPGATDPVNILLNVTANLLARDITVALDRAGLHPGFGALHATEDGRDSAVYDLMEEFRASMCESVVAQAINFAAVSLADFETRENGAVRLKPDGYKKILRIYEHAAERAVASRRDGKKRRWRGIMVDQALGLAAHVEGRGTYQPYVLDY